MIISEVCIKRPVLAIVLNLLLMLVGIVCFERLAVREYPNIDTPVVTVETLYPGASAEIIESQITKPLENMLSGIEGIDFLTSISRQERSQITVTFRLARDADDAANDVRDRVARVRRALPEDIDEPIVAKVEADAQPIIWLALNSAQYTMLELSDYAERILRDRLQTLPGVADVRLAGLRKYAMRIWLDPERMAARNVTVADVEDALNQQNIEIPAGRIESIDREFTVLNQTDLNTPEEFERIIIRQEGGYLVRLSDVARVELGAEDVRRNLRYNGETAVGLGIIKQSTANPLEISNAAQALIKEMATALPEGMHLNMAYNSAIFIDRSIASVYRTFGEAVALVVAVIFLFLRSARATIIPLVTIPISLIGGFAIMYVLGFTVNTLTLLAMVLAIGLVVDDAIVVLENTYRHIEDGMKPIPAAMRGIREIGFAVVAMTLTLAAVFAPLAFAPGKTGKLFVEFALTLAGAVIVSGFTALTLTPMMCSRLLKHETKHGAFYYAIERVLEGMRRGYAYALGGALRFRGVVVFLLLAMGGITATLMLTMKSELSPLEDRGTVVGVAIAPEGSTIHYTDENARRMEALYSSIPEIDRHIMIVGFTVPNQALSFVRLKPWEERTRSQMDIAKELSPKFSAISGVTAFASNPPSLGQSPSTKSVEFIVQTSGSYAELQDIVQKVLAEAQKNKGFTSPDTDLKLNKPELLLSVDREKLASLGISVATVGRTLETLLGSRKVTRFKQNGEQYEVMVQVEDALRMSPSDLSTIFIRAADGTMVQLPTLLSTKETVAPRELNHFNKLRAANISSNLSPEYSLGEALKFLETTTRAIAGDSVLIDYNGVSREFKESASSLQFIFILALVFIYLVLAAQFESFVDPFVIMLTVPLAMAGALLALWLTGGTLNVYSQIGLVALVGLITKNGILIVEFANQLRDEGKTIMDAVRESAELRLRPIVMTTAATVLGALPLALSHGAGAESRQQIGWVIVGGMVLGTFFTLFVIPVCYTLLSRKVRTRPGDFAEETTNQTA